MAGHATPNLPAIDFEETSNFYQELDFEEEWRGNGWMVMTRGALVLEFFHHPELAPGESWFSCCLHLDDLDGFHLMARATGIPNQSAGWPRMGEPNIDESGIRIAYIVDPNGSLIRLIQN